MDTMMLKQRLSHLKAERSGINRVFDDIDIYVAPFHGRATVQELTEAEIRRTRPEVWDFTAIDGAQKYAANIHTSITNPAIRWYKYTFLNKKLKDDQDAKMWLEKSSESAWDTIQESDFNTEVSSFYQELVSHGTACFMAEVQDELNWKGIDCQAIPIREVHYEACPDGTVDTFYRDFAWTAQQIVDKFGKDQDDKGSGPEHENEQNKGTIPQKILEMAKTPDGAVKKLKVVYCISERESYIVPKPLPNRTGVTPVAPERRKYGSVYFLEETGERLGTEGGFFEMPVWIVPWEKTPGSLWGHGPGILSLPTVKYLNKLMELFRGAMAKVVDPTTFRTERGITSRMTNKPGGVVVARSKEDVWVHESASRFDVTQVNIEDLRQQVRAIFRTDELQLKDSPAMTATESQIRYELMNRLSGSTLTRIESSFLSPFLKFVLAALYRAGRLEPMPQQILDSGGEYGIEYQGALARSQRTDEVAAIERLAAYVASLAQLFPDAAAVFDPVQAVREIADRLGTPASVLRSKAQVERELKAKAAIQQQMLQAEADRASGEAVQQSAEAVKAAKEAAPAGPGGIPQPARPVNPVQPPMPF